VEGVWGNREGEGKGGDALGGRVEAREGDGEGKREEDEGIGDQEAAAIAELELAKLSLSAILIDTSNLQAEGKVSPLDREVVAFLEGIIMRNSGGGSRSSSSSSRSSDSTWNRANFHAAIAATKANSLDLLSLDEVLGRDYKSWVEAGDPDDTTTTTCSSSGDGSSMGEEQGQAQKQKKGKKSLTIHLGIASIARPLAWLLDKARHHSSSSCSSTTSPPSSSSPPSSPSSSAPPSSSSSSSSAPTNLHHLLQTLHTFAHNPAAQSGGPVDLLAVMTTYTDDGGEFRRELCVLDTTMMVIDSGKSVSGCGGGGGDGEDAGQEQEEVQAARKTRIVRAVIQRFSETASGELGLRGWGSDDRERESGSGSGSAGGDLVTLLEGEGVKGNEKADGKGSAKGYERWSRGRIWHQDEVGMSRKQVAPLLREAVRFVLRGR